MRIDCQEVVAYGVFVCVFSCSVVSDSLRLHELYSPPGSSVHWNFPAETLELVAISSSRGSSQPRDQTLISCIVGRFFTAEPQRKPNSVSKQTAVIHLRIDGDLDYKNTIMMKVWGSFIFQWYFESRR